jgi:hypothetical protein
MSVEFQRTTQRYIEDIILRNRLSENLISYSLIIIRMQLKVMIAKILVEIFILCKKQIELRNRVQDRGVALNTSLRFEKI